MIVLQNELKCELERREYYLSDADSADDDLQQAVADALSHWPMRVGDSIHIETAE